MKIVFFIFLSLLFSMSLPLRANENTVVARSTFNADFAACPMTEDTQININFNSEETDLSQVNTIMDNKLKEIEDLAKAAGVEDIEMQSMNYNIYVNNPGGCNCPTDADKQKIYRLNGNMNFKVQPSEKALELLVQLNNKGYAGGMNVNKYRRCN